MRRMTRNSVSETPMTNEDQIRVLHDFQKKTDLKEIKSILLQETRLWCLFVRRSVCVRNEGGPFC